MDYYQKYMKYKNKYLHAKHTLGYDMSGGAPAPKKIYIFFQDVTDADNFMSVVAFIQLYGLPTVENPIHFVLTRRPENLGIPKYTDSTGPIKSQIFNTLGKEFDDPFDSLLIGEDSARRFITFMHKHYYIGKDLAEAYKLIKVYDGGCPDMSSNLSHTTHTRDYLFDRGDLLSPPKSLGDLITPTEYLELQIKYNKPELLCTQQVYVASLEMVAHRESRQATLRKVITTATNAFKIAIGKQLDDNILLPLNTLLTWITEEHKKEKTLDIVAFALAPLTGLSNLFKTDITSIFKDNLTFVYGQLFAWDNAARPSGNKNDDGMDIAEPGTYTINSIASNIFKNQFNIDCDTDVVEYILTTLDNCPRLIKITWIPTEMVKNPIQQNVHNGYYTNPNLTPSPIFKLWYQWSRIKGPAQIIFDPSVIFHAYGIETGEYKIVTDEKNINYVPHDPVRYNWYDVASKVDLGKYNRTVWQMKIDAGATRPKHTAAFTIDLKVHNEMLGSLLYLPM